MQQQGAAARAEQQGAQRGEQQAGPARRKVASARPRLQARPLEAGRQTGRQADRQTGAGPGRLGRSSVEQRGPASRHYKA